MTTFNPISPSGLPDKFGFVEIPDVTASSIVGGIALVGVDAIAEATGDSTYAYTNAMTQAMANQYVSIAFGYGTAIAIGDNASANVSVYGRGDKVIQHTYTYSFDRGMTVSNGFVLAIDYY
jgi:hypothetical protein